ncbi:phage minor head protein [Vibrio sp. YMD68]|uniref:phage head morphogenesis protein n=1 Tax=Vibrio sp. YMD68 TaxID=3042300 RepID=UPI00249B4767|nr:phage minor head protein [Vibrio sp. YMD68]WGV98854.1 phage minor head protein [Vibrio sp. YMD68]WGW01219.1 phage minor head protein [Vibrio sp. YMD68]
MSDVNVASVPHVEATEVMLKKLNIPTRHWDDMLGAPRARGFAVAGATKMSLLKDLHDALNEALSQGKTITDFRKAFDETVLSHGWTYNGKRGWRTKVIFNNNLNSAYSAGRWQQFERQKKNRPYLTYMTVGDDRVRDEHDKWRYLTLPIDDPFWDTYMPPNDFGCRCYVLSKSEDDINRENLTISHSPEIKTSERINTRTGELYGEVAEGVGVGWDYNVGKVWLGPDNSLGEYIASMPEVYRKEVLSQNKAYISQLSKYFNTWSTPVIDGTARGKATSVGLLSVSAFEKVQSKSATIFIDDWRLKRMSRELKRAKSIDLPKEVLQDIPGALDNAVAILLDKRQVQKGRTTLVYVIKLEGQKNKYGKLIVDINYQSKTGFKGNGVVSGSVVSKLSLQDSSVYEVIEGSL